MHPIKQIAAVFNKYPDLGDLSWVGENPRMPGLILGFCDGDSVFTDTSGEFLTLRQRLSERGEAINGVASIGQSMYAASTRSEITIFESRDRRSRPVVTMPYGAHGVVATKSGIMLAPMGHDGFITSRQSAPGDDTLTVVHGSEPGRYFYHAAALDDGHGAESVIFAGRRGGFGVIAFDSAGETPLLRIARDDLDIIDVCAVAPGSLSAVAVSKFGEGVFIQDAPRGNVATDFTLAGIVGPIRKILATPRHLFVLSSKTFRVAIGLTAAILHGDIGGAMPTFDIDVDAHGMALVGGYILLLMANGNVECMGVDDADIGAADRAPMRVLRR